MLKRGDWGPVKVIAGKYKGRTGYYDEDDDTVNPKAIVYLGVPFKEDYVLISRRFLEPTDEHRPLTELAKTSPDAVNSLGVRVKR